MATPRLAALAIPEGFTAHERLLVEKAEIAVVKGLQLERWSRDPKRTIKQFSLDLNRSYKLPNKAWGYFSDVTISGQTLTALGVQQQVEFGPIVRRPEVRRVRTRGLQGLLDSEAFPRGAGLGV